MAWHMGTLVNGTDSMASTLFPAEHWSTLRALILVVSDAKKDVSSTAGMQATVATSALFETRARDVVPHRMGQMAAALEEKDFSSFGLLTMRDSNNMHATCADTWPPINYLNDGSRAAIRMVEAINAAAGEIVCAYTFDAGPNAVCFFEEENAEWILASFKAVLGNVEGFGIGAKGAPAAEAGQAISTAAVPLRVDEKVAAMLRGSVSRVIVTGVGEGPTGTAEHLVDDNGGSRVR